MNRIDQYITSCRNLGMRDAEIADALWMCYKHRHITRDELDYAKSIICELTPATCPYHDRNCGNHAQYIKCTK